MKTSAKGKNSLFKDLLRLILFPCFDHSSGQSFNTQSIIQKYG